MADPAATNAPVTGEQTAEAVETVIDTVNTGAHLYRAYLLDVDTDPENPQVLTVYKRGDEYPETQSRIRAILNGDEAKITAGDKIYKDGDCTEPFTDLGDNWTLTLVRKSRAAGSTKKGGVDREWLRMVINNPDSTPEEKIAAMAKFI